MSDENNGIKLDDRHGILFQYSDFVSFLSGAGAVRITKHVVCHYCL